MKRIGIFIGIIIGAMIASNMEHSYLIWVVVGGFIGYLFTQVLALKDEIHLLEKHLKNLTQCLRALEEKSSQPHGNTQASSKAAAPSPSLNIQEKEEGIVPPPAMPVAKPSPIEHPAKPFHSSDASSAYVYKQPSISDIPDIPTPPIKKPLAIPLQDEMPTSAQPMPSNTVSRPHAVSKPYALEKEEAPFRAERKPVPPIEPSEPLWFEHVWQQWIIGGNPLLKVGILILFLGLAFLLRYASEHAVLPIELRYAVVAATGIGLVRLGWRWRERKDQYGLILQGGGVGVLYLTTLAAMKLHPLIPYGFGFVILLGVAGYAALLAILQDSLALAIAGTLGGFAAPVLASHGGGNHVVFFSYLTILNLGIVAIAWFKAWRPLNAIGFVCTFALGSAWASEHYQAALFSTTEPFVLQLFILYVLITFLFARRTLDTAPAIHATTFDAQIRHAANHIDYIDGFLAMGVPFATFGWQYLLVKSTEYGAAFSALGFGLVYIVLARALFTHSGTRYALLTETLIGLSVIFGSLAIPLGLEHTWTCAAWAVEAAGMYWIGIRQHRVHARLFALLLLVGSGINFTLGLHWGNSQASVLEGSWLGCLLLAGSAGWIYWQIHQTPRNDLDDTELDIQSTILGASAFFLGLLPFLLWPMEWAAPALALLGAVAVVANFRLSATSALLQWGIAAQALAGIFFLNTAHNTNNGSVLGALDGHVPFLHSSFLAPLLIALAAFACTWVLQRTQQKEPNDSAEALGWTAIAWAGIWWSFAWAIEITRVIPLEIQTTGLIAITILSAWLWSRIAQQLNWRQLGTATIAYLPVLSVIEIASQASHPLAGWGCLAWPIALLMHGVLLQQQSANNWHSRTLQTFSHTLGVWLFVVLASLELRWHFAAWGEPEGTWALLGWIIAPISYLWIITRSSIQETWLIREHQRAYTQIAAIPMLMYALVWIWFSNWMSDGTAAPLPYIPLLNPLEIAQFIVVLGLATWCSFRCAKTGETLSSGIIGVGGITILALVTGMVMRTCHHWGNIPWHLSALFGSTLVQTSLSITWSCIAIGLMVSVKRHQQRWIWMSGAALISVVVLKLFLVELSDSGSLARIVSFIVVGILLLLVGYFAPLPPKASTDE